MEIIKQLWVGASPFQPQVISFFLTLAAALILYIFRSRVRLIYGQTNNSFHQLKTDQGTVSVYCEKHYIQNTGRKPAEFVEVVFSCAPSEISIFPSRSFTKTNGDDGEMMLAIPYISPRELIIIDTIHVNSRTAELRAVHCPESAGKRVAFWITRKFRPSLYALATIVLFLGTFYLLQLAIRFAATIVKAAS